MIRLLKTITPLYLAIFLSGCSSVALMSAPIIGYSQRSISPKATKEQQQQVKQEVMQLLEKEYKQPFKLESFEYKYQTHNRPGSFDFSQYGSYYFKVQAPDNPIIVMDFRIDDINKSSTNELIEDFKKRQLKSVYCAAFPAYYRQSIANKTKVLQPYTKQTEKFCDSRNQTSFHSPRNYYLKHQDEYK
ncbi:hypothetical protein EDC55_10433 [Allofrancisella inopinata]|uniref:Lipoprotein n=1 Tax=Allofrancisella inopinata TaxID=1085647 RepID=A0AAE6YIS1_9GAMM|nr:hypothetical protein [Allofrancisella inopinata]QIV96381.1 hypothetical protein E4K63_05890 [Allofrancisella inopinata]TDT73361.1 hypothetical protein EDC55_10433 [Allofrancisella inopinata]